MVAACWVIGEVAPHRLLMMTRADTPASSTSGRSSLATCSNAGSISSLPSRSASQVCLPHIADPIARSASGVRHDWQIGRGQVRAERWQLLYKQLLRGTV